MDNTGIALLTCCGRREDITVCACRFYPGGMYRDCGKCPKTAPWDHCAHWAIQYPEARLLSANTLQAADIRAEGWTA